MLMGSLLGRRAVAGPTSTSDSRAGWGVSAFAITACILSYASLEWALYRIGLVKNQDDHPGKTTALQSTASSAGYSTGGTLISAFAAYIMIHGHSLPIPFMLAWVFFFWQCWGVTMAIPMKRQMINIEQLRFPSGIAAAETLRALHSHGEKRASALPRRLAIAGRPCRRRQVSGPTV